MRLVVIGGTGHIGTFLIPRLVNAGHEVIVASRGKREPYVPHPAWNAVQRIEINRAAEDAARTFGARIASLETDAVVDLICFTPASAQQLVDALHPRQTLLLHCGTMWVHGRTTTVPPNEGMETVHHVHADDVAQAFELALTHPDDAVGESFHVVSPAPLTLRAYAEAMFAHFGQQAQLGFLPWEEWRHTVTEDEAAATWDHIAHSPHGSISKARQRLGYAPRYTSLEAVVES